MEGFHIRWVTKGLEHYLWICSWGSSKPGFVGFIAAYVTIIHADAQKWKKKSLLRLEIREDFGVQWNRKPR